MFFQNWLPGVRSLTKITVVEKWWYIFEYKRDRSLNTDNGRTQTLGPVNIGILGLGTVGCGTVNVLTRNADEIARRAGRKIRIATACARDLNRLRDCNTAALNLTSDAHSVVSDPDIDVVVELIGGDTIAKPEDPLAVF